MISHSHFTRIADKQDVDAKTVERDYVLTHVLAAISRQPGNHGMVLKGGTALLLCYFEDYRYSADLDFSLEDDTNPQAALELVQAALGELAQRIGLPHLAIAEDEPTRKGSRLRLGSGPLAVIYARRLRKQLRGL